MKIELIPVLDIYYTNQGVPQPAGRNAVNRDVYEAECLQKAGFADPVVPYLSGATFYRLVDLSDANLTRWLLDHTRAYREGEYEREGTSPFFGGYVLKVDGEDKFFPQCCGDLGDIKFWKGLAASQVLAYEGHPAPITHVMDGIISFEFTNVAEDFSPLPPDMFLSISVKELAIALEEAERTLLVFQERIGRINVTEGLNIENIHELLIWGSGNCSA